MDLVIARVGAADADVVFDRAVEQPGILEHGGDRMRSDLRDTERVSMPSIRMRPSLGSKTRCSRLISVVLPAPVGPTMATVWPAWTSNEIS